MTYLARCRTYSIHIRLFQKNMRDILFQLPHKEHLSCVLHHIVITIFTTSKPGCPNIIKCMDLVRDAIKLLFLKLFSIWGCTFLNAPLIVLIWLGWPPAQFIEFHFYSGSQKAFRHRQQYIWPPYNWHLQQPLIWQWFTTHTQTKDAHCASENWTTTETATTDETSVMRYVMLSRWIGQRAWSTVGRFTLCSSFKLTVSQDKTKFSVFRLIF